MKKTIERVYSFLPILICICYFIYLHCDIVLFGDDLVYKDNFNGRSVVQWSKDFYNMWGGRVPLQLLDNFFLSMPLILWKIFNCILILGMMLFIYKYVKVFVEISNHSNWFAITTMICIALGIIPTNIVKNSILWVTGSFNYLLPAVMLIIAVYPFLVSLKFGKIKKKDIIMAWPCVFLCCYAEQTAAIFICLAGFCVCYNLYKKKRIKFEYIVLYIFGVVNVIFQFAAPGNNVRYDAELLRWYQSYAIYNPLDRILLGIVHFMKSFFITGLPYFIIILVILGIIVINKEKWLQVCYAVLCGFTLFVYNYINNINDEVVWKIYDRNTLIGTAIVIFWILYFALVILIALFDNLELACVSTLCFLASVASGAVMGMSPTIYASGYRVFLISYIMIAIVVVLIFSYMIFWNEQINEKTKMNCISSN